LDKPVAEKRGWRLKKTLARKPDFRPIENDDLKYAWAAYKKGALASMGGVFGGQDLSPAEFKEAFEKEVLDNYHGVWTLLAQDPKRPIGFVLGFFSHPNPAKAPFMIVGDMIWMPWATPRNRLEAAVSFFASARKEMPMMEFASEDSKRFFEVIARHGVMRRVGTSHNVYTGAPAAVFETRRPD
jgi:hypothetical protein